MKKTTMHALVFMCTLAAFQASPSLAADAYQQGAESYRRGDYKSALNLMLAAAKTYPSNAAVQYQLANIYMQLNRRLEAKKAYQRCLSLRPDVTTATYCSRMISFLSAGPGSGPSGTTGSTIIASTEDTGDGPPQSNASVELERKRQEILMKAAAEARKIKAEAEREIREIDENTQQRVIDMDTGAVSLGISSRQAKEIRDAAEERANEIMSRAEDRAKHL